MIRRGLILGAIAICAAGVGCARGDGEATEDGSVGVGLVMETDYGSIAIEVYPEQAPVTAENFLNYVDGGHFDGASFYRAVSPKNDKNAAPISVIQGGLNEALSAQFEAPFAPIAHETTDQTGLQHIDGALSMARFKPGSAQSEFFISIGDNHALDAGGARYDDGLGFAVFGRVVGGMEVVNQIHHAPVASDAPDPYVEGQLLEEPVRILSVRRAKVE